MAKANRNLKKHPFPSKRQSKLAIKRLRSVWRKRKPNEVCEQVSCNSIDETRFPNREINEEIIIGSNDNDSLSHITSDAEMIEASTHQPIIKMNASGPPVGNNLLPVGRRIIDVNHFFESILQFKHDALFNCSFSNLKFLKEYRKGFVSIFHFECQVCKKIMEIPTDVNKAAVSAIVSTGGGYSQLKEITSALDIPPMSNGLYQKVQKDFLENVTENFWQSIRDAGEEEAKLAYQLNEVDEDGVPLIAVCGDGAWSKRSYRTNYNAHSGVGCIIGARTKKILFLAIRNKYCCICDRAKQLDVEAGHHICFKNWIGSSTAMETSIIVEGFKCSLSMHGIKYSQYIGDGDSSVHRKIMEERPYGPNFFVEKIECYNHLLRNYCARLRDLSTKRFSSKGTQIPKNIRDHLAANILRLRTAIDSASKYHQNNDAENFETKLQALKEDILNSPNHIFGDHQNCASYFCNISNEVDLVPTLKTLGLYDDLISLINSRLMLNLKSLLLRKNSNAAETYNSVVCKFVGGKRINYTNRYSYELRCKAAALSYNARGHYYKTLFGASATNNYYIIKDAEARRRRILRPRRLKKIKGNTTSAPDEHYGPDANQIDMLPDEFEKAEKEFLDSLQKSCEQIKLIERSTIGQSSSPLWYKERMNRLTASNFGRICKMRQNTNCGATVKQILYSTFRGNSSTRYGLEKEIVAIKEFEKIINTKVDKCGLFLDIYDCYLAASPDGLIGDDSILEVKCPATCAKLTPEEAMAKKIVSFATLSDENTFALKRNNDYYFQVQGQLHITQRKVCYFVFWTPLGILYEKITRDDNFWESVMANKLKAFYFDCLLPEIIDSRHNRNLPIRNPAYRE